MWSHTKVHRMRYHPTFFYLTNQLSTWRKKIQVTEVPAKYETFSPWASVWRRPTKGGVQQQKCRVPRRTGLWLTSFLFTASVNCLTMAVNCQMMLCTLRQLKHDLTKQASPAHSSPSPPSSPWRAEFRQEPDILLRKLGQLLICPHQGWMLPLTTNLGWQLTFTVPHGCR